METRARLKELDGDREKQIGFEEEEKCKENRSSTYEMNRVCHLKIKILNIGSSICKAMMIVQQNMLLVSYEEKKNDMQCIEPRIEHDRVHVIGLA